MHRQGRPVAKQYRISSADAKARSSAIPHLTWPLAVDREGADGHATIASGAPIRSRARSELCPLLCRINSYLMRWLMNKYKRYRTWKKAIRAWTEAAGTRPRYFADWA